MQYISALLGLSSMIDKLRDIHSSDVDGIRTPAVLFDPHCEQIQHKRAPGSSCSGAFQAAQSWHILTL